MGEGDVDSIRLLGRCLPALREAQQDPDTHVQASAKRAVQTLERKLGLPSSSSPKMQRKAPARTTRKPGGNMAPNRKNRAQDTPPGGS